MDVLNLLTSSGLLISLHGDVAVSLCHSQTRDHVINAVKGPNITCILKDSLQACFSLYTVCGCCFLFNCSMMGQAFALFLFLQSFHT